MKDIINAAFELGTGFFCWMNVLQIMKDKDVKGISWTAMLFFTSVGFWNLYYYPALNQWVSFFGGLTVLTANIAWVSLAYYYIRKRK